MLEGRKLGVLENSQKLIAGCGVNVLTLVVLTFFIHVLLDYLLLVKGGWPFRNVGCSTRAVRMDEG